MTKRCRYIFILLFATFCALGQIHPTVGQIFYDLPLDETRSELRELIAKDKRFTSTDTLSEKFKDSIPYFRGVTTDQGLIKSKPDLIEMQLTFGSNGEAEYNSMLVLNFKYFYSSKASVEAEYKNLVKLLSVAFKDSTDIKVETPYSTGLKRYKATGKQFKNLEPYYRVEVLKATMPNKAFGLFVEFRRKE
jgi:hypothetical protein